MPNLKVLTAGIFEEWEILAKNKIEALRSCVLISQKHQAIVGDVYIYT